MLTEEGIKALLPAPNNQTAPVSTEPPVLETPTVTLPAGTIRSTNPPVQNNGDRLLFDPADTINYSNVTLPASSMDPMATEPSSNPPLESQIPREITLPEPSTKPPNKNFTIIISVAVALAIIALVAFFTMRRPSGSGAFKSAASNGANLGGAMNASPSSNI